ncbi:extracellular calcium-sensing receptor-like [Lissotriton helveticus]
MMRQRALQGTFWLLAGQKEPVPNYRCLHHPPLAGIVGDGGSSNSMMIARVLGLMRMPQISYLSTNALLSDRIQFPSFFRTIPSDDFQSRGMAQMVLHFGWRWVGLVADDNDYGQQGIQVVKQELLNSGACIAFSENIILNQADRNALHIVQVIKTSTADAVVIFALDTGLAPLLNELAWQNVTQKVWIASEGWSTSALFSVEKYRELLTGTVGFAVHHGEMPGFQEYFTSLNPEISPDDMFIRMFWEEVFGCKWVDPKASEASLWMNTSRMCTGTETLSGLPRIFDETNLRITYNSYNAAYALAMALQDLSSCRQEHGPFHQGTCADIINVQPWQVPLSVCSLSCRPGLRKAARQGEPVCCFQCVPCPTGEISNHTDSAECFKCPSDHWTDEMHEKCIPKVEQFLSYGEPLGFILTATSILFSCIPFAILALFISYWNTPIVKANNRSLSYLLLLSLSLCFLCSLAFIGYPTTEKCLLRQPAFGITFALCVSCILSKTLMVVIAFNATKPNKDLKRWVGPQFSYAVISVCTLLQVVLCAFWLILAPPFSEHNIHTQPGNIIIECNEGSSIAFWSMLGYLGLLATISFLVAFLARKLPDSFNEAKFITFSMLAFLSVWLTFVPAYLSTRDKFMVAMEIFAILASSSSMLSCIFFPKCYIILLKPKSNSRKYLLSKRKR